MIMKRLLLITWCLELTSKSLFTVGLPADFKLSSPRLNDFNLKWQTVKTEIERSTAKSEMPTTLKTQHEAQKAYKNEYGYSISEIYDSQAQKNNIDLTSMVPDTKLLYHSLSNPLFKSNSLNIEPHGDIHKISGPFKSGWIFSPSYGRSVEKRGSPNLSSMFKGRPTGLQDSMISSTNFSLQLPDNFTLNSNRSLGILETNSSFLSDSPSFDNLKTLDDVVPSFVSDFTSTTTQPITPKSTFFGYNIKEVTANGKTHGTVQVFGNDGIEKNVEYNELTKPSNITKLLSNVTTSSAVKNLNTVKLAQPAKTQQIAPKTTTTSVVRSTSGITTAIPKVSNRTNTGTQSSTRPSERPRHIIIEDVQPLRREFTYDQPIASDFATPEFILYDFIGQLQTFPYIPTDDFNDNRYSTFDELVSENTYVYMKK